MKLELKSLINNLSMMNIVTELGVLVGKGGYFGNVFRITPPLCFTKDDAGLCQFHFFDIKGVEKNEQEKSLCGRLSRGSYGLLDVEDVKKKKKKLKMVR